MKRLLVTTLMLFLLFSCQDKYKERGQIKPIIKPQTQLTTVQVKPVSQPKIVKPKNKRFVFVVVKVEEPSLYYTYPDYSDILSKEVAFAEWGRATYCSKVVEIEDFNEDEKYKLIDEAKRSIMPQPADYVFDVQQKVTNSSTKRELLEERTKIRSSVVKDFSTYKQAAIGRTKYTN